MVKSSGTSTKPVDLELRLFSKANNELSSSTFKKIM